MDHKLALPRLYGTDGYAVLSHISHKLYLYPPKISATDVNLGNSNAVLHKKALFCAVDVYILNKKCTFAVA